MTLVALQKVSNNQLGPEYASAQPALATDAGGLGFSFPLSSALRK
jgi:hypothetical protein